MLQDLFFKQPNLNKSSQTNKLMILDIMKYLFLFSMSYIQYTPWETISSCQNTPSENTSIILLTKPNERIFANRERIFAKQ